MENSLEIEKIIRVEARGNESLLIFENGEREIVGNSIDDMEQEFRGMKFTRIHPRHLINTLHYKKLSSFSTPAVELDDGTLLPVDMNMIKISPFYKEKLSVWNMILKIFKQK